MLRPHILTPASFNEDQPPAKYHFNKAYISAIERAGGLPIGVMRPEDADIDALFATMDGLFLMGGNDIDPKEYKEEDHACVLCEPERDRVEIALLKKAIAQKMPILAICRGFQVLNVALGGTLYQDVLKEMPGAMEHSYHRDAVNNTLPRDFLAHEVTVSKESMLYGFAKKERMGVNSLHHQGIKKLGEGLRVSAVATDGLIEAIEVVDHPFGIAVEWHPEELHDDISIKIFESFIDASKKYRETKKQAIGPACLIPHCWARKTVSDSLYAKNSVHLHES